ncbi:bifunctional tRNA (5-methylaminomethyl-2-thiouridine)(34)-methyltransferase MnmD/FAD-dependent 5-carboxymethylaminomethyl-2-thiouridine(34) oxidoreductase MnmC [Motilimonas eburnea]|uniref:bifunctional tRNA (5-methylaminomethyl-2-thiouridine)(34)-methyltransferase MnmD/FAD-dependent 5-carboxymethylaminomethyl-2-thiouridine(34) oxidoreductase MnmC n=1 Tax=Motilimonas eburnea TaxID=1737488 RepID=UPI001E34CADA|nr:bifunctional tRNA (5-methylaminomethyl-2-thiouridine)(34)-methyltransferase MnmD/FAD-dependent 5-carboxymethylaminomethyl-2-thiouridine(34) oxidoreductase MnmC [Motilimonas eburnea]MCE2571632.1 bifunctional tRNA (5-methylaminomethyl-2-thiouridine)(34)-methyltransferase MnmD/FAD-dependent 5-carboxymethylaminomethyl-2-thiouridine(34) oxidoreductase MnmC [Motilimonas eburnea]
MINHKLENAQLEWNANGTPISSQFDDIYFSNINGLEETQHVFIKANGLPSRWHNFARDHFVIAETGFGTGLNFLVAWHTFNEFKQAYPNQGPQRLYFTSFEKFPLTQQDLQLALAQWPELAPLAEQLVQNYPNCVAGSHRVSLQQGQVILDLWFGDLHDSLPQLYSTTEGLVDCWFLDGFAPSKNPDMWSPALFNAMGRLAKPGATVATFTAAGFVRRGLGDAGFVMTKPKGFGRKREMLAGHYPMTPKCLPVTKGENREPSASNDASITLVGGGIASAATALALVRKGRKVTLYCQDKQLAQQASGNRQGALYPLLSPNNPINTELFIHAFDYSRQLLKHVSHHGLRHQFCGVMELSYDDKSAKKINLIEQQGYPSTLVSPLTSEQANQVANLAIDTHGLYYPQGGWLNPGDYTLALIAQALESGRLTLHLDSEVGDISASCEGWQFSVNGQLQHTDILLLCMGSNLQPSVFSGLPIFPVRGQVSHVNATPTSQQLNTVLCYQGYMTPAHEQSHCIGASYGRNQDSLEFSQAEQQQNHDKLLNSLPQVSWPQGLNMDTDEARVSVRCGTRDNLPFVGKIPVHQGYVNFNQTEQLDHCGLYMLSALGSRGLCTAPLMAELLACEIVGEPLPVGKTLLTRLHPNRYWLRSIKKGRPL